MNRKLLRLIQDKVGQIVNDCSPLGCNQTDYTCYVRMVLSGALMGLSIPYMAGAEVTVEIEAVSDELLKICEMVADEDFIADASWGFNPNNMSKN